MSKVNFESQEFSSNPYQPSSSPPALPEQMDSIDDALKSLARWQIFFAFLGFLASGLTIMLVLFQLAFTGGGAWGSIVMLTFLAIIIYLAPSVILFKAALAARAYALTKSGTLAQVFDGQRLFWRFIGIIVGLVIGLYMLILIIAFIRDVAW